MSGGGYQGGTGSAGKGGALPNGVNPYIQPNLGATANAGSPGKGGMGQSPTVPPTEGTGQTPVAENATNPMGPNAFETGLNAQNNSMDWMRNAMNYQAPQLGGNYGMNGNYGINGNYGMNGNYTSGDSSYTATMAQAPGQDLYSYDPATMQGQSYQAAQLSDQDINQYMNPYTQNVIDSTMNDLDMARQNALNNTGVAATRGGAFGGDRHGIMEAQNNNDYMQNVARTSAQLRNQGFQNAQRAAMGDVSAQNQAFSSNAAMAQQAGLANQAAQNARDQFVGQTANQNAMQTALANQNASNRAAAINAQLAQANNQFNASQNMAQDRFNAGQNMMMDQFNAGQNMTQDRFNATQNMTQDRFNAGQNMMMDQFNAISKTKRSTIRWRRLRVFTAWVKTAGTWARTRSIKWARLALRLML